MTDKGPVVLECGILLDAKIDRLLMYAGINVYQFYLKTIIGEKFSFERPTYKFGFALSFLFSDKPGYLVIDTRVCNDKDYLCEWERVSGDHVSPPNSISDIIGWVITKGETSNSAYNIATKISHSKPFEIV